MPRSKPKRDPVPDVTPNIIINVNVLIADIQLALRHDEMSRFDLTIEYVQGAGTKFFWRAYVRKNGHVSASSKMQHHTPGGAVKELWIHVAGRD